MKSVAVFVVPVVLGLAALGASAGNSQPTSEPVLKSGASAPAPSIQPIQDIALFAAVGDVMVEGCTAGDARCEKAWKDLARLAGESAL